MGRAKAKAKAKAPGLALAPSLKGLEVLKSSRALALAKAQLSFPLREKERLVKKES